MKNKIAALLLSVVLLTALAACAATPSASPSDSPSQSSEVSPSQSPSTTSASPSPTEQSPSPAKVVDTDREGNPITLPDEINTVMVIGPSTAEMLAGLGLVDKIVIADQFCANVEGIKSDFLVFDMKTPDVESIISMKPDVLFVTGMIAASGEDPYKPFKDAGICVIYIPTSSTIQAIKDDIRFVADVMGVPEKSEALIKSMDDEINAIKAIGDTITEKKTVYFEISSAPYMYSFGTGVYLDELLTILGAKNALGDQTSWVAVADEAILEVNPDVILTNVNYIDNPVDEIKSRAGWDALNALKNNTVYYIDTDDSSQPCQNIVKALREMAKAIYPDKY